MRTGTYRLIAAWGLLGCGAPPAACLGPEYDLQGTPLGVHCAALVDTAGRQVLLHGINVRVNGLFDDILDDGSMALGIIPGFTPSDAQQMRAMGFNALRLTLNWSGIEPTQSGGFVDSYLDQAAAVVDACGAAGMRVLLDLHQDGYTKYIGDDGAPLWAVIPAPPPRDPSDPDADVSGPALAAFDTFFGPTTADGPMLRQRFGQMLAHVAARFAADDTVLGFELYNEPLAPADWLVDFDQQMLSAVRAAAPGKLVLFEPDAVRNVVDSAPPGDGSIGPGTVYAPHVYTGVFSTVSGPITKAVLQPSEQSARREADGYLAPLVITEWGYDPQSPVFADYVQWEQELQDQYLASAFFWVWKEVPPSDWGFFDIDPTTLVATVRPQAVADFARVRPEAIAGTIQSVTYDPAGLALTVQFTGDAALTAPNLISIGGTPGFASYAATCDGHAVAHDDEEPASIVCGGAGPHTLVVSAR